ncbi:Nse4 C-terminal-domain-containing protein [Sporodiniella umbellata]|nr:Nse4 C-terminal-domain-containing protein [Sporodiniella umbellata]
MDTDQYNPYQDEGERRRLRKLYRELTEKTLEMRRELTSSDVKESNYNVIDKSNVLYDLVRNPQEAVLDSRLLALQADINTQKAKNLKIGTDMLINLDEFVSKIISSSKEGTNDGGDEFLDWEYIGKNAIHFGKRAVSMDFMLGPLAVEQKQIKRAKTTRLIKNKEDLVIPAKLKEGDIKEQENETSKNVNDIYKILSGVEPINYFKFVTNPDSFSQTVENIFYVSFLARTAVVGINIESGQPILSTTSPPNVENDSDIINKKQIVMGIDMKEWREIIETYNITTSYIPTREKRQDLHSSGTKWY